MKLTDFLPHMVVFARVVEAKSFSAAALRLNSTKSAVSKQIARLEGSLGTRLLNRTTRRIALTEVGTVFYEHCLRAIAEAEAAEHVVDKVYEVPHGVLRVASPTAFGHLHLAPRIGTLLERFTDLGVELTLTERRVDLAEEGFDVAIQLTDEPARNVVAQPLAPINWVVCATPAYLRRHGSPQCPEDLTRHACLSYSSRLSESSWRFESTAGPKEIPVGSRFCVNNGEAVREVVLEHHGIALLPTFVAWRDLAAGSLVRLLPDRTVHGLFGSHIRAVYPASRRTSPKIRVFVDFYLERIGSPPYWDRAGPR